MERVNSILKIIIGFAILVSFVTSFSSCESKNETEGYDNKKVTTGEEPKDSSMSASQDVSNGWESIKGKVNEEEKEMDAKFDELEAKASKAGDKVKTEVNESVKNLKSEKKTLKGDSLSSDFKDKWEAFKMKTKESVDKMDEKLKK